MTLKEIKDSKLPLAVFVAWSGSSGDYIHVSRAAFLKGIGGDYSHKSGGLMDATDIDASISNDVIQIG